MIDARAKLAEKFGDATRIGGKNTARRKKKAVHKTQITDDKKLKSAIKKFGVQPFPNIDEVNMFRDDSTIIHFKNPEVLASLQNNTLVVIGKSETKNVKELLPEII
jgi:nascent polypeptide-associated complex subunit beta